MNDRNLMEDILLLEKGVCELYMHGAIESCTANVNKAFSDALNDSLSMQDSIYGRMQAKGWVQTENAPKTQVDALKQKFTAQ